LLGPATMTARKATASPACDTVASFLAKISATARRYEQPPAACGQAESAASHSKSHSDLMERFYFKVVRLRLWRCTALAALTSTTFSPTCPASRVVYLLVRPALHLRFAARRVPSPSLFDVPPQVALDLAREPLHLGRPVVLDVGQHGVLIKGWGPPTQACYANNVYPVLHWRRGAKFWV
jgi:hypothetical protein